MAINPKSSFLWNKPQFSNEPAGNTTKPPIQITHESAKTREQIRSSESPIRESHTPNQGSSSTRPIIPNQGRAVRGKYNPTQVTGEGVVSNKSSFLWNKHQFSNEPVGNTSKPPIQIRQGSVKKWPQIQSTGNPKRGSYTPSAGSTAEGTIVQNQGRDKRGPYNVSQVPGADEEDNMTKDEPVRSTRPSHSENDDNFKGSSTYNKKVWQQTAGKPPKPSRPDTLPNVVKRRSITGQHTTINIKHENNQTQTNSKYRPPRLNNFIVSESVSQTGNTFELAAPKKLSRGSSSSPGTPSPTNLKPLILPSFFNPGRNSTELPATPHSMKYVSTKIQIPAKPDIPNVSLKPTHKKAPRGNMPAVNTSSLSKPPIENEHMQDYVPGSPNRSSVCSPIVPMQNSLFQPDETDGYSELMDSNQPPNHISLENSTNRISYPNPLLQGSHPTCPPIPCTPEQKTDTVRKCGRICRPKPAALPPVPQFYKSKCSPGFIEFCYTLQDKSFYKQEDDGKCLTDDGMFMIRHTQSYTDSLILCVKRGTTIFKFPIKYASHESLTLNVDNKCEQFTSLEDLLENKIQNSIIRRSGDIIKLIRPPDQ